MKFPSITLSIFAIALPTLAVAKCARVAGSTCTPGQQVYDNYYVMNECQQRISFTNASPEK